MKRLTRRGSFLNDLIMCNQLLVDTNSTGSRLVSLLQRYQKKEQTEEMHAHDKKEAIRKTEKSPETHLNRVQNSVGNRMVE